MRKHAESLKVDEVVERAREVAGRLVEERFGKVDVSDIRIGWHPGHGTVGLVVRKDLLRELGQERAFEVAETITREFDGIALEGSARFTITRDFGIMGFFPLPMIDLGGFR